MDNLVNGIGYIVFRVGCLLIFVAAVVWAFTVLF